MFQYPTKSYKFLHIGKNLTNFLINHNKAVVVAAKIRLAK